MSVIIAPGLLRVQIAAYGTAEAMREIGKAAENAARAFGPFGRALAGIQRRHRSGHRHRGTVGHRLRYAPASAAPLGQRTAAKRRAIRIRDERSPESRAALAFGAIRRNVGAAQSPIDWMLDAMNGSVTGDGARTWTYEPPREARD